MSTACACSALAALVIFATACAEAPKADPAATRESAPKVEASAAPASTPVASAEPAAAPAPSASTEVPAPSTASSAPHPSAGRGAPPSAPVASSAPSSAPSSPPAAALPTGPVAGKPWKVVASADADAGYHCNADYPNKFTPKGGTNVTYPEAKVAGACAGDRVVATIPFVPTAAGPGTVTGTLSYGICDDKKTSCLMKKKDVTLAFTASP